MTSHAALADRLGTTPNWISGEIQNPESNQWLPVINPSNGKQISKVALSNASDVDKAVLSAKEAHKSWSKMGIQARVEILLKFHALCRENFNAFVYLVNLENGKNVWESEGEVKKGMEFITFACSAPLVLRGNILRLSSSVTVQDSRVPLGVISHICPFNFPFMVPLWVLGNAIAAGNTVILKPSEKTPMCCAYMMELLNEAGLPKGVVNIVNGAADAVTALIEHPDVNGITFVGSSRVAKIVSEGSRMRKKRCLALGGAKNHLIAMPECNISMSSDDICTSFTGGQGQRCMASSVLVLVGKSSRCDELLDLVVKKAASIVPGKDGKRSMGPIIDKASLDKIHRYISQAERDGAKVLLDGRGWQVTVGGKEGGCWIGPTILEFAESQRNHPCATEEIFGPVLSVLRTSSKKEALEIENSSNYGNGACIYTDLGADAEYFADGLDAGMIGVNIGVPAVGSVGGFSFGGWNDSSYAEFDITGSDGFLFLTKKKKRTTKWAPVVGYEKDWTNS